MSDLFGEVWFWSVLAFGIGVVLTVVLLVRPAQQRVKQLEKPPTKPADTPSSSPPRTPPPPAPPARQAPPARPSGQAWPSAPSAPPAPSVEPERDQRRTRWMEQDSFAGRGGYAPVDEPTEADVDRASSAVADEDLAAPSGAPTAADQARWPQQTSGTDLFEPELEEAAEEEFEPAPWAGEPEAERRPGEPRDFDDGLSSSLDTGSAPTGLPKRQRGASSRIRGGFEPPKPITPSLRAVVRRTPQDAGTGSSLFEPTGDPDATGHQPPPARAGGAGAVPPGPFGPGSAMPLPGGERPDPSFAVKASVTALRYCTEDSPQFPRMVAEVWFASPADAERVGFRPVS